MKLNNICLKSLMVFLLMILNSCSGSNPVFQEGTFNTQQIDDAVVAARQLTGLRSLLIKHKGVVIKEEYFGGGSTDNAYDIKSITKSITSLLIGIAVDKGYIQSLDQDISGFISPLVPSYPADKANLKIRHLITMSGGFEGNELTNPELYNIWAIVNDRISYILNVPLVYQPGTHFSYDSRPYHMLSPIITRASGLTTKQFAETYLFTPLSIGQRTWNTDKQGYFTGSAGLYLTAKDMMKIGELVLNDGMYNGTRIISAGWIQQLNETKISTQNAVTFGPGYSYGFWTGNYNNRDFVFAMGWGGQFIIIVPSLELIITAASNTNGLTNESAGIQWQNTIDLIMTRILTAFH